MSAKSPALTFVGAVGTVTGSKTILDTSQGRVLIDCGLFQGLKKLRQMNWAPFPCRPESIDAVVLTHAHLDHCGYLPRLVRLGFAGPIFCTEGTRRLAEIVLPDSGHLQEEEARFANRKGYSKHDPAEPLYTKADAMASLDHFDSVGFDATKRIGEGLDVTWQQAGHILGAATVELHLTEFDTVVRFSGDLGTSNHPLLSPPAPIGRAEEIVSESTYGDTNHPDSDPADVIESAVGHIVEHRGALIIPAFAVDRTEVVLWHLNRLVAAGDIPAVPIFVDSPMASRALDVYEEAARNADPELRPEHHGTRLFSSIGVTETMTVEESKALNSQRGPLIIISASGMATGGRVIHHLAQRLGHPDNAVMLVGFQAPGTRGESLRNGAPQVKMFGRYFPVRARVFSLGLSAHADQEDLVGWLSSASPAPRMVYVNHGEPRASEALVNSISTRLGFQAVTPHPGERVSLNPLRSKVMGPVRST